MARRDDDRRILSCSGLALAALVMAFVAACGGEPRTEAPADAREPAPIDAPAAPDAKLPPPPPPDAACASGHVDCSGVCDGPGVPNGSACCASGHVDCSGVCDGPGIPNGSACCASGHVDCSGVCDGPGIPNGGACCASGHVDCSGVCDGPGIPNGGACCASGHFDCNGVCDGPGVPNGGACCASGHFDCNGVCDGPGIPNGGACCASGHVDCDGVCDGTGVLVGTQCCAGGVCPPPTCSDGYVNGSESDVDCGGDCLRGCGLGARCVDATDCAGLSACVAGKCAPAGAGVVTNLDFGEVDGLARNPHNGYVYVSIGAGDATPDRVLAFAPGDAKVAWSVSVPASPQSLAVSDDGTTLYVGIVGPAPGIVKVDLATHVASPLFSIGQDPQFGLAQPGEMVVVPGDAHQVAVATWFDGSTALGGVHFYRDGVERFPTASYRDWLPGIPFNKDVSVTSLALRGADTLFTYDGFSSEFSLARIGVAGDGPHLQDVRPWVVIDYNVDIRYAAGRLFASNGQVVDPDQLTVKGTLPAHGPMTVADDGSRAYVFENIDGHYVVSCDDPTTFTQSGGFEIASPTTSMYEPIPSGIERWGDQGLALTFRNPGVPVEHVVLLPDALARAHGCAPHATPPFREAPANGPDAIGPGGARIFALDVRSLATDPASGTLYASVGSNDLRYPNRIVAFPSGATAPAWSCPVGSEPGALAIADDGETAWVGLDGEPVLVPVSTSSRTPAAPIELGYDDRNGEIYAGLIVAVPTAPHSVAESGYFKWTSYKPGIAVFDDGVRRFPMRSMYDTYLAHADDDAFDFDGPGRIYAGGNGKLVTMDLGPSSLTTISATDLLPTMNGSLLFAGGKIVNSASWVVDPVLGVQLGMIPWSKWSPMGPAPRPDFAMSPDGSRVYTSRATQVTNQYAVDCFDTATRTLSGSVTFTVPGLSVMPSGVVLYGTHGAAVRWPGALVLLPDALSAPGCSPTP